MNTLNGRSAIRKGSTVFAIAAATLFLGFGLGQANGGEDRGDDAPRRDQPTKEKEIRDMDFGTFSLSLTVNDIATSKSFYESLGFTMIEGYGGVEEKWLILEKDDVKIGLFEKMFPKNSITFNPGNAREIYAKVKDLGIEISSEGGMDQTKGPCYFAIVDPDGNPILFDQHQ